MNYLFVFFLKAAELIRARAWGQRSSQPSAHNRFSIIVSFSLGCRLSKRVNSASVSSLPM